MKTPLILCELADPGLPGIESYSPFCMKAHRALRVLDLTYERRFGSRPAVHKAHNPTGQVPILLAGDRAIADSTAILRWLDETSGGALTPGNRALAAEAWLWEELGDTAVNGFTVAARWADDVNWPLVEAAFFNKMPRPVRWIVPNRLRANVIDSLRKRDVWRGGASTCWDRQRRLLDDLEARAPEQGFWMGEAITVADLGLFPQLHGLRTPLTVRQAGWVAERPRLSAWLDRVQARTSGESPRAPQKAPRPAERESARRSASA